MSRQGSERSALDVPGKYVYLLFNDCIIKLIITLTIIGIDHEYLLTGSSHSGKSSGNKRDKKKRTYSRYKLHKKSEGLARLLL